MFLPKSLVFSPKAFLRPSPAMPLSQSATAKCRSNLYCTGSSSTPIACCKMRLHLSGAAFSGCLSPFFIPTAASSSLAPPRPAGPPPSPRPAATGPAPDAGEPPRAATRDPPRLTALHGVEAETRRRTRPLTSVAR
jgi:hypothetical protein